MRKLLFILLFPVFGYCQKAPTIMAEAASVIGFGTIDTLYATGCDPNCGLITGYQWTKVSGPGSQAIVGATTSTAQVVGLQSGLYIFKVTVKNTAGMTASDTVGFVVIQPCPAIIPCPKVDTAAIQALKVCPAPIICPVCPPVPKQRTAVGISWDIITNKKVITYDNGSASTL